MFVIITVEIVVGQKKVFYFYYFGLQNVIVDGRSKKRAVDLLMKAAPLALKPLQTFIYNTTMLHTEIQGETTVAFVGSSNGNIQKVTQSIISFL